MSEHSRRHVLVCVVLTVFLVTAATRALSDSGTLADPVGDQLGPMSFDIESVGYGHRMRTSRFPRFLTHSVTASNPVTTETIRDEEIEIRFNFDISSESQYERSIIVRYDGGQLQGEAWIGGFPLAPFGFYEPPDFLGFVRVTRPNEKQVVIDFSRSLLKDGQRRLTHYRWMVEVYRTDTWSGWCGPGDTPPCYDRTRRMTHHL